VLRFGQHRPHPLDRRRDHRLLLDPVLAHP
jgi:hypothetical protein